MRQPEMRKNGAMPIKRMAALPKPAQTAVRLPMRRIPELTAATMTMLQTVTRRKRMSLILLPVQKRKTVMQMQTQLQLKVPRKLTQQRLRASLKRRQLIQTP